MAKFSILAFIGLILVCSLQSAVSSPFIVAHKRISQNKLNADVERVSVSIDIYNSGSVTAYDVTLTDDSWAEDIFDLVSGNISMSWDKVDAGSLVSHSFELESKTKTVYYGAPAVITYRAPTKAKFQEAYSTPILPLNILAEHTVDKKFDAAKRLLVKYSSHVSAILLIAAFANIIANPSKQSGNKKRN